MNFFAVFSLLATMLCVAAAAAVPGHPGTASKAVKRTESTFAWREYFVRNCTAPYLRAVDNDNKTIDGNDCKNLSAWQSGNNGGYYELWDFSHFNNYTYRPIVGHDTCVVALHHVENDVPSDYAVMGSLDVIDLMANALSQFQVDGKMPTISGVLVCGPNAAPLNVLIYNGRTGWQGTNYSAASTSMHGPALGGTYATGTPPAMPAVSVAPAGPTNGT